MQRLFFISLVLVLGGSSAIAQVVDMRNFDDFEWKRAEKRLEDGLAPTPIDEGKLNAARERREEREDAARKLIRARNAGKSHVYALGVSLPVPSFLRPFQVPSVQTPAGPGPNPFRGRSAQGNVAVQVAPAAVPMNNLVDQTRVLFLPGESATATVPKLEALRSSGFLVVVPELPANDFKDSVQRAEWIVNQFLPDVIVGESRGGAVAINMQSGDTPLVLLAPAWRDFGQANAVKRDTVILHAAEDRVVRIGDSEQLLSQSKLPRSQLVEVGQDHRLIDDLSLQMLVQQCLAF